MPFPECGAMTQGYIGYHLQQAIQQELKSRGMEKECATVVTQVVVDEGPRLPAPDEACRQLLYEGRGREDRRGKRLHLR